MNPALIGIIINELVLPEVLAFMERRRAAGLPLPTLDELKAELKDIVQRYVSEGEGFLDRTKTVGPTNDPGGN